MTSRLIKHAWVIYPLALLIVILRAPDRCFVPQLWAEDGSVFLLESVKEGWSSLFDSYAGYQLFMLRLVAVLGRFLPLEWIPAYYYAGAMALLLLGMALIHTSRMDLPAKPWLALCLPLVAFPSIAMLNLTNSQWFLVPAIPYLLLQQPADSWKVSLRDGLLVLALGLTGPFMLLWLPLLALRFFLYGFRRMDLPAVVSALASSGVQLSYIIKSPRLAPTPDLPIEQAFSLADLAAILVFRPAGHYFFGNLYPYLPYLAGAMALLLAAWTLWMILRLPRNTAWFCLAILICGALVLGASLANWNTPNFTLTRPGGHGDRYYLLLFMFTSQSLVLLAFSGLARIQKPARVLLGMACLTTVCTFTSPPLKDLRWRERLHMAMENPKKNRLKVHPMDEWDLSVRRNPDNPQRPFFTKDYLIKKAKPPQKNKEPAPQQTAPAESADATE